MKTPKDIKEAIDLGLHMNLDNELEVKSYIQSNNKAKNLFEVSIVNAYLSESGVSPPAIGLRINPVVGAGHIAMISTATKLSKFGLPLMDETRERIIQLFVDNQWLSGG